MVILQKIGKFLRKWNELLTLPIAILLWLISPVLLHWADPTAATYDAGIFQTILFGIIKFLVAHFVAWILIKLTFPKLYEYLDDGFEADLTQSLLNDPNKNPFLYDTNIKFICVRLKSSLLVFALYLLALVACMAIL